MLDFSPEKLLLIAAVALILVGPKRLPQIGRSIGRWLGDLRRATGSIADEMKEGLAEPASPAGPAGPVGPAQGPPPGAIPSPAPGPPPPAQAAAPAPAAPPPVVPPTIPGPPPGAPPPPAQP